MIKQNVRSQEKMLAIYCVEKDYDKLYQGIKQENKEYLYDKYLEYIAIDYSDELYERYRRKTCDILEEGMGREIYSKAVDNFSRISRLDNGKEKVNKLKTPSTLRKPALFDEIRKQAKRLKIDL